LASPATSKVNAALAVVIADAAARNAPARDPRPAAILPVMDRSMKRRREMILCDVLIRFPLLIGVKVFFMSRFWPSGVRRKMDLITFQGKDLTPESM
jgi:hypothetical protein